MVPMRHRDRQRDHSSKGGGIRTAFSTIRVLVAESL